MDPLDTLQAEFNRYRQQLTPHANPFTIPTRPSHDGAPHIEYSHNAYHFIVTERGQELERRTSAEIDDVLYWLLSGDTFGMACRHELAHRREGIDGRRVIFHRQVALLQQLNPDWAVRKQTEIDAILTQHPFVDSAETLSMRSHWVWRALALGGTLFFAAGIAIAISAYRADDTSGFALMLGLSSLLTLGFAVAFWCWSAELQFEPDALIVRRWGHRIRLPYNIIQNQRAGQTLTVVTAEKRWRFWFPALDFIGRAKLELDERTEPYRQSRPSRLPITFRSHRGQFYLLLPMGLMMLGFATGLAWALLAGELPPTWDSLLMAGLMIPAGLLIGGVSLHAALFQFTWWVRFSAESIDVRHTVRTVRYPLSEVAAIQLKTEPRSYRGVTKEVAFLDVALANGDSLKVESGMGGYPMDYSPVAEAEELARISAELQHHYQL